MGKHSRKRQRTTKDDDISNLNPIGSVTLADDDHKDEEEKQLESLLFGTTFPPSNVTQIDALLHNNETSEVTGDASGGLANLMDSDVSHAQFSLT